MRGEQRINITALTGLLSALSGVACSSSFDSPPPEAAPFGAGGSSSDIGLGIGGSGRVTDTRAVEKAKTPPPPITGGTLLALSDGKRALVADPDRDRIWIVDYQAGSLSTPIVLEQGAQPTRAVEDDAGQAYVVLRGTGDIMSVDLATATAVERRHVCIAARGISLAPERDKLLVSCAEGRLVELPFSGSGQKETVIPTDARDVVVQAGRVLVSRFRAAELLEVTAQGVQPTPLPKFGGVSARLGGASIIDFEPGVAWRTALGPSGHSVVVVHQRATTTEIQLPPPETTDQPGPTVGPSQGGPGTESAYAGDSSGCGGIVQSAVTVMQDGVTVTSPQLAGVVLPVDVAVSSDGYIAVASAGSADSLLRTKSVSSAVQFLTVGSFDRNINGDCVKGAPVPELANEQITSVAFEPGDTGRALVLARDPFRLFVVQGFRGGVGLLQSVVSIPGDRVTDTGHEIFHRDAGGGIACASCHPEGTDDGRTWNFLPIGGRRTQPIDVGLSGTAPFHWDGDLPTVGSLMSEVFVRRMGGFPESPERINAIESWVFSLRPRAAVRAADDPAAVRGQALFSSAEVGCATCHAGSKFTSATSFDVGTGGKFQVPSLLGVAQRLPLMHTGCAHTLRDRFDASCGGTAHGNTSQLDESQLSDLIAYLESI
ncbi:MAG TPA: cytochrome-c peroxidase [Polyangiaceae bacterium]|nr:cytochrome-c peroxidase [Polyangiaceae bacterium]